MEAKWLSFRKPPSAEDGQVERGALKILHSMEKTYFSRPFSTIRLSSTSITARMNKKTCRYYNAFL